MNLHIDNNTGKFRDFTISNLAVKRGDSPTVNLYWLEDNSGFNLSATEIRFAIKQNLDDVNPLVYHTDWSQDGDHWTGRPSFNGSTLASAISGLESIEGILEVTWTADGTNWESTIGNPTVTIESDLIRGVETLPADSWEMYPDASELLLQDDLGVTVAPIENGKLPENFIPNIAIVEYLGDSANQSEMLSLSGQKGDWTIRIDESKVFVITGNDPSNVNDWTSLEYPPVPVTSVAGKVGDVSLSASDIEGLGELALLNQSDVVSSVSGRTGVVTLSASDINGLGQLALLNTSDVVSSVSGRTGVVNLSASDIVDSTAIGRNLVRAATIAHALSTLGIVRLYKPADENRTSPTLANDTHLVCPLEANKVYKIAVWWYQSLASGNHSLRFQYTGTLEDTIGTSDQAVIYHGTTNGRLNWDASTGVSFMAGSTNATAGWHVFFTVPTKTAGNFAVQWSAGNGTGLLTGNTTAQLGCNMIVELFN